MSELDQFQFHPRCKEMKLTHLCFAADLIMCCKGKYASIHLLLRNFKLFSNTSSLKANIGKFAFYTCGMNEGEEKRILKVYGFQKENFPFRALEYLYVQKRFLMHNVKP